MTSRHVARIYALLAGIVTFFVAWAGVAAHPWAPRPAVDPRLAALTARQQQVRRDSLRVQKILASRNLASASTPSIRIVKLPPVVVTRTS